MGGRGQGWRIQRGLLMGLLGLGLAACGPSEPPEPEPTPVPEPPAGAGARPESQSLNLELPPPMDGVAPLPEEEARHLPPDLLTAPRKKSTQVRVAPYLEMEEDEGRLTLEGGEVEITRPLPEKD